MVSYNTYGGVALVGTATNSGNSNSNATAMRVLALAIYMGLDTGGTYLAAFNALETFITNSATFMKAENIIRWPVGFHAEEHVPAVHGLRH